MLYLTPEPSPPPPHITAQGSRSILFLNHVKILYSWTSRHLHNFVHISKCHLYFVLKTTPICRNPEDGDIAKMVTSNLPKEKLKIPLLASCIREDSHWNEAHFHTVLCLKRSKREVILPCIPPSQGIQSEDNQKNEMIS